MAQTMAAVSFVHNKYGKVLGDKYLTYFYTTFVCVYEFSDIYWKDVIDEAILKREVPEFLKGYNDFYTRFINDKELIVELSQKRKLYTDKQILKEIGFKTGVRLKKEADKRGLTVKQLMEINHLKEENNKILKANAVSESEKLQHRAQGVKKVYPRFNLKRELKNDIFSYLVNNDYSMLLAYEFIHRDELFKKRNVVLMEDNSRVTSDRYYDYLFSCMVDQIPYVEFFVMSEDQRIKEAKDRGLTVDQCKDICLLEDEGGLDNWNKIKIGLERIADEASKTKTIYSQFNIEKEWNNKWFNLAVHKMNVTEAYVLIHMNEIYDIEKREEMVDDSGDLSEIIYSTMNYIRAVIKCIEEENDNHRIGAITTEEYYEKVIWVAKNKYSSKKDIEIASDFEMAIRDKNFVDHVYNAIQEVRLQLVIIMNEKFTKKQKSFGMALKNGNYKEKEFAELWADQIFANTIMRVEETTAEESDVGLVKEHPVYVLGADEEREYLRWLRSENGKVIDWERVNVHYPEISILGAVNEFEGKARDGEIMPHIFINIYGSENMQVVPRGFKKKEFNTN